MLSALIISFLEMCGFIISDTIKKNEFFGGIKSEKAATF